MESENSVTPSVIAASGQSPSPDHTLPKTTSTPCLIPVDITSETEHKLFYNQRKVCGWKYQNVPAIFEQMNRGDRIIYWICIPAERPVRVSITGADVIDDVDDQTGTRNNESVSSSTNEWFKIPLLDSSRALHSSSKEPDDITTTNGILINNENIPQATQKSLLPIGHIALDHIDYSPISTPLLGSGDGQIVSITTLFILPTYRKSGIATWAMEELERLIIRQQYQINIINNDNNNNKPPVRKCQQIGLSTLSHRHWTQQGPEGTGMWERVGLPGVGLRVGGIKSRYLGDWYRSLGYEFITEMRKFTDRTPQGEEVLWWGEIWGKRVDGVVGLVGLDGLDGLDLDG